MRVIKGLESLCIYIARFGNINRKNATEINEAFSSNINIILHPAGSVSKRNPLKISEDWQVKETKTLGNDTLTGAEKKVECLQEL